MDFESDVIKAGTNVTERKTDGKVIFNGDKITLSSNSVVLDRGTTIVPRTQVGIKPIK